MRRNTPDRTDLAEDRDVPAEIRAVWQRALDTLAGAIGVPASLVMRVHERELEVYVQGQEDGDLFADGARAPLGTGLYCETVMERRETLLVPDARQDPEFKGAPGVDRGLVSYLGMPLTWPTGKIFGTICVFDTKRNAHSPRSEDLLGQFRQLVQSGLALIHENRIVRRQRDALREALDEVKTLRGIIPICAACKSVRDDQGFWQQVEIYLGRHSEAEFSHGCCPDCVRKLYPDLEIA